MNETNHVTDLCDGEGLPAGVGAQAGQVHPVKGEGQSRGPAHPHLPHAPQALVTWIYTANPHDLVSNQFNENKLTRNPTP